jgi:hypothetical protein
MTFLDNNGSEADDGSLQNIADTGTWIARRQMQVHPELEQNFRSTIRGLVGPSFSDDEMRELENRALDHMKASDLFSLRGLQSGAPATLSPNQKSTIDGLLGRMPRDPLGQRALDAYGKALGNGSIRVR